MQIKLHWPKKFPDYPFHFPLLFRSDYPTVSFSIGWGTGVRVRSVLVLNKSAASLTGRLTPPRHPRRSAPSGAETSTRPSTTSLHKLPLPDKTRRGRAGAAAEPLCASPRFRPLSRFVSGTHGFDYRNHLCGMYAFNFLFSVSYFWETVAAETRSLRKRRRERTNAYVTKPCAKTTMYQPMNVFQISPEIVPYSVSTS